MRCKFHFIFNGRLVESCRSNIKIRHSVWQMDYLEWLPRRKGAHTQTVQTSITRSRTCYFYYYISFCCIFGIYTSIQWSPSQKRRLCINMCFFRYLSLIRRALQTSLSLHSQWSLQERVNNCSQARFFRVPNTNNIQFSRDGRLNKCN